MPQPAPTVLAPPAPDKELASQAPSQLKPSKSTLKDFMQASLADANSGLHTPKDDRRLLRSIAMAAHVEVHRGRFSWLSAACMCLFVVTGSTAAVLSFLAFGGPAVPMVSEELSYIAGPLPVEVESWGLVRQPEERAVRVIGEIFRFPTPQLTLFIGLCCASFGLFTVAYFCSEVLVQDLGVPHVKDIGTIINQGVDVYLMRTAPAVLTLLLPALALMYVAGGWGQAVATLAGSVACAVSTTLGTNMNFEGAPRFAHQMNFEISAGIQLSVRSGAIAGLTVQAMALAGTVIVWLSFGQVDVLVGFSAGACLVAFYMRIGGGIFSKGCDVGADFVNAELGEDVDDHRQDAIQAHKEELFLNDVTKQKRAQAGQEVRDQAKDPNAVVGSDVAKFITHQEALVRADIEKRMELMLQKLHPVVYLDAIGENIADVGGTSSDLFVSICVALAAGTILGAKAHEQPYLGTTIPFAILSAGTFGCSLASYYVWSHEKHTARRLLFHLKINLFVVLVVVEIVVFVVCYFHWSFYHSITYDTMVSYCLIVGMGLAVPELCAGACEFFTSVNCAPVAALAEDARLGMVHVVLEGIGQGFASAGVPAALCVVAQLLAYRWQGLYGVALLSCASQAGSGWQATMAAWGAVANNGNRIVHLTTINELAHHRANVAGVVGTIAAHNSKCVAGQCSLFAANSLLGALLADKYTKLGENFQIIMAKELSEYNRAGLFSGIAFTLLFVAVTITSCVRMARRLVLFCRNNPAVGVRPGKVFPTTHLRPVKTLVAYAAWESYLLTLMPLSQTLVTPVSVGLVFGFRGLLQLLAAVAPASFSLGMFLLNSGQAWDAARKFVLFGMLRNPDGKIIAHDSEVYSILGIGEQVGGPLEDLAGPSLNNFVTCVVVVSWVSSQYFDETPDKTWGLGCLAVAVNFLLAMFFRFSLPWVLEKIDEIRRLRREAVEYEEGVTMLRELESLKGQEVHHSIEDERPPGEQNEVELDHF